MGCSFQRPVCLFSYSPDSTKNITVDIKKNVDEYYGKKLYVDYKKEYVFSEIKETLGKFTLEVSKACYGPCPENIPEKSCEENIIIFNESKLERIYQKENCLFIDGDLRSVDTVIYKILGINP